MRAVSEREARLEQARQLQQVRRYAEAQAVLLEVPSSLRDQQTRQLLAELETPLAEIKRLRASLAATLQNGQADRGLGLAERLVELEPHADDIRRLCEQLQLQREQRDAVLSKKLLAKAKASIAKNDYGVAQQCLERMPRLDDENDSKLLAAIAERVWLVKQLRSQPFADKTLLALAERLIKLQPKDANALKVRDDLAARLARAENRAGRPYVPWLRSTNGSHVDASVEPISNLAHLHWDRNRAELLPWISNLRPFLVALGLGLSGLGRAPLDDLDFKLDAPTWLARLTGSRRPRASAAWGLDFGTSGLKVIRLTRDKGVISIDRSAMIAYATDQARSETNEIQVNLAPAFEQFIASCSPGDEPLAFSFPGIQTLGRFFALPAMKSKRLQTALEFEIGNQIPLSRDEVVWGAHEWQPQAGKAADGRHHIAVAAAKRSHAALRAGVLGERRSRAWIMESECVALLHVLLHCHADQIAQLQSNESIVLVDVGDSATNVVAASPARGPWFRSIYRGIRSLNRALVQALDVTWQQADQMRQQWPGSRPMVEIDRALAPAIDELTRELERALRAYRESMGARICRIYVAGGGCDQFGLLRDWSRAGFCDQRAAEPVTGTVASDRPQAVRRGA
jgi:Tfp pilus assembly PilM family ATPase